MVPGILFRIIPCHGFVFAHNHDAVALGPLSKRSKLLVIFPTGLTLAP